MTAPAAALDLARARGGAPLVARRLPGRGRDLTAAADLRARQPAPHARIGGCDLPYAPLLDRLQFATASLVLAAVSLAIAAALTGS